MSNFTLTCAEVRAEMAALDRELADIAYRRDQVRALCAHDETQQESDYQDPKPYWRCLGCARTFYQKPK